MKTNLIIIGSGPGGYRAAEYAAKNGMQVVIAEDNKVGGTCLNEGCIPTKTLCHEAEVLEVLKSHMPDAAVDFNHLNSRLEEVTGQLRAGVEQLLSMPGINLVRGHASFKDAHTIMIGDEEYQADHIIIATGSHAKMPPIKELDDSLICTSTEMLHLDHLPHRLVIVGAGVIGMEFASIFNTFGSEVTIIEFLKECLPTMDSDIAKRLRKSLEKRGVNFMMQAGVEAVTATGVTYQRKGKSETIEADTVLIATGREPNLQGLNLEAAGVDYNRKGIMVDEHLQTNIPGIYAIGDVNARMMLAHAATMQGFHAINHILEKEDHIRLDIMPAAVFTHPEAACVGLTEDQCKEQGLEFVCKKGFYRSNGKALAMDETEGIIKLLADNQGRLIGCHVLGAHAADLVQEVAALMNLDATVGQLREMVHIHPTLGEILQNVAELF